MKIPLFAGLLALSILFFSPLPTHLAERGPSSDNCLSLAAEIMEIKSDRLPIGKNSIFDRYSQLVSEVEELVFHDIYYDEFYVDFLKLNNRAPTLRDGVEHSYKIRTNILNKYDQIIKDLDAIDDAQLNLYRTELKLSREKLSGFKDLDQLDAEIRASHANGKTLLKSLDEEIALKDKSYFEDHHLQYLKDRAGQSNFHGEYGELFAMGAIEDEVIIRGLVFAANPNKNSVAYEQEIIKAVANLRDNLETKSTDEIIKLVNLHGEGLLRHTQKYIDETPAAEMSKKELIDRMINMIKSKEIDLVTINSSGSVVWSEVKAFRKTITPELLKGKSGNKSIYEQLLEHKALRDLLGLESTVKLHFISSKTPITPEAKTLLESIGYTSMGAQ